MKKGRKVIFLPFSFFLFLLFFHLNAVDYIFKGFRLQDPIKLLESSKSDLSPGQVKTIFEQSGFFRSVAVRKNIDSITITVVEYPLVKKVIIKGNTVYDDPELVIGFGIKVGDQFNSRIFREGMNAFYKKIQGDGYTHWQVLGVKIRENGSLLLEVDEGILGEVIVEDDLIDPAIIRFFFSQLLGKPFNALKVKYVLEEMLFTGAFYSIDSEVISQKGQVILRVAPEKKRLGKLKSGVEYSTFGGFQMFNIIGVVNKNPRLDFLDIETRYIDDGEDEFFQLNLYHYNFQRNLGKSFYATQLKFFYTSFAGDDNLFFEAVPSCSIPLFKNLIFSLSVAAGIHKNFSGLENELIAEARTGMEYQYISPLNRTELSLGLDWAGSVLQHYNRQKFMISFIQHFFWGDLKMYGQWNESSGEDLPFNNDFIHFEKTAFISLNQLYIRDSKFFSAEFSSRPVWSWLRIGILVQYFVGESSEWGYGLAAYLTIRGFPLRVTGFIHEGKFYLSAGTRLSF